MSLGRYFAGVTSVDQTWSAQASVIVCPLAEGANEIVNISTGAEAFPADIGMRATSWLPIAAV